MQKCRQPLEPLLSVSVMPPGGACSDVPRDVPPGSRVLQVKKNRHGIGRPGRPAKATYKELLRWDNDLKSRQKSKCVRIQLPRPKTPLIPVSSFSAVPTRF
jgi:hypothetical protein